MHFGATYTLSYLYKSHVNVRVANSDLAKLDPPPNFKVLDRFCDF